MRRHTRLILGISTWILILGCAGGSQDYTFATEAEEMPPPGYYDDGDKEYAPSPKAKARKSEMKKDIDFGEGLPGILGSAGGAPPSPSADQPMDDEGPPPQEGEKASSDATRQWFPESFLWQPLVETDQSGQAQLEIRVPDQLTTWRVLALAHNRQGAQAGTIHTFDSTLPIYVDPVVPGWLYAGDRLDLPVQVVNNTGKSMVATLAVLGEGALSGGGTADLSLDPWGTEVNRITLQANASGGSKVHAALANGDAVVRSVPVMPAGRPMRKTRAGSLSGPRTLRLKGPDQADPRTQELEVLVFPGPLAVLQTEVERVSRSGTWDGAYGFALANRLRALSAKTGVELDAKVVRKLQMLAWQRVVRQGRSPDAGVAADLLTALNGVEGHQLAEDLQKRLVRTVVSGQRADGTWARQNSARLQRVIVQTAYAARALPDSEEGARLRATGALERYAKEVKDPYTAAMVLATGLLESSQSSQLEEVLLAGIEEGQEGEHRLVALAPETENPWGYRPTQSEYLAWVTLALLHKEDLDWRGDLVAELMERYDATWGFRAGAADSVALEAVARALPGVDEPVSVVLTLNGQEVAQATVDPAQPKVPAVLVARPAGANPEIGLRTEKPVAGMAYVMTLNSWVPWTGDETLSGVDVEVDVEPLQVGRDSTITFQLAAPAGVSVIVEQGIPAGAYVDDVGLGTRFELKSWDVMTDRVRFETRTFKAGEILEILMVVRPAFAGKYSTLPLKVEVEGKTADLAPFAWEVRAG